MGSQGNLMFTIAYGGITPDGIDRAFALHRKMKAAYPSGYLHFLLTRFGAPMPGPEARGRLQQLTAEYGESMIAAAIVIEGDGLWAGSVRLALRTMAMTFRRAHPQQFFGEPNEALAWLEREAGGELHFRPAQVLQAIREAMTHPVAS